MSMSARTELKILQDAKKLIPKGCDYITDDHRLIIRGYKGLSSTAWVNPEEKVYYNTLLDAYYKRSPKNITKKIYY